MSTVNETDDRARKRQLLAERLKTARAVPSGPVPRGEGADLLMTPSQRGLWVKQLMETDSAAYAVGFGFRLRGSLQPESLEAAVAALGERYDILSARYPDLEGDPVVIIDDQRPGLTWQDLSETSDPGQAAETAFSDLLATPFQLGAERGARFLALRLGEDDHAIIAVLHHIVADGWSVELLQNDLLRALDQAQQNLPIDLGPKPLQYEDVALWEASADRAAVRERGIEHWTKVLSGVQNLELDIARPRPSVISSDGRTHQFTLDRSAMAALKTLAADEGATLYMAVLALYQVVLARHSGQRDFAIGTSVANRDQLGVENVVGQFVNMIALRTDLTGAPSFRQLLGQVRERALDAFSHQQVPFDDLVRAIGAPRSTAMSPIFQVSLAVDELASAVETAPREVADLVVDDLGAETSVTHFDLGLNVFSQNDEYIASLTYRTDLFDEAAAVTIADRLELLLERVLAEPDLPVLTLDLFTGAERERVTRTWALGPEPRPESDLTLVDLVRQCAGADLSAPAVVEGDRSCTLSELHHRSDELALRLTSKGVGPEVRVAVALDDAVAAAGVIIGILKAGGAYLPLDPSMPRDRLDFILADSGASMLVHDGSLSTDAAGVESCAEHELSLAPKADAVIAAHPDNLAYIIYTSGTTGHPKGVEVTHREIVRYLRDISETLRIQPGGNYALLQSLAFDFSLLMFYLPLVNGGTLHVSDGRVTGDELAAFMDAGQIDYLKMTPSHLAAMVSQTPANEILPRRALVLAGEAAPTAWAAGLAAEAGCTITNSYGPTETVVACSIAPVTASIDQESTSWPLGTPMPGVRYYILDEHLQPVLPGVRGELYVAGRLARGYLSRPAMTSARFVADPFHGDGERMYRTGDVVSWRHDGSAAFHGRTDDQIKIRGYRVELGEVESTLQGVPGVAQAVVDLRGEPSRERLVAWVRWHPDAEILDDAHVRAVLEESLPEYMVPRTYGAVDEFPTKGHGKVDRKALVEADRSATVEHVGPRNEVEEIISATFAELLQVENPSVLADFFDLGGDSLMATKVVARLKPQLGEDGGLAVMDVISHPTIEALALLVTDRREFGRRDTVLFELTRPVSPKKRTLSIVAVPYGGANASVYTDLAKHLGPTVSLFATEPPGHDVVKSDEVVLPTIELANKVVDEIIERIDGPVVIYGHCVPGSAVAVAISEELTRRGRDVEALYVGGAFPVARPQNKVLAGLARLSARDRLTSDRNHANWLAGMGADMSSMDPDHAAHMVRAMRQDGRFAEDFFTELYARGPVRLDAPVISVIGEADSMTEFWEERFDEWSVFSDRTAAVLMQDAGHYFLNFRADELAEILTTTHVRMAESRESTLTREARGENAAWWLHDSREAVGSAAPGRQPRTRSLLSGESNDAVALPGMGKFSVIAAGQMISFTGSTLTGFALPLWVLTETQSLVMFGLVAVLGILPNILISPLAGAIVDRYDRRRLIIISDAACLLLQAFLLVLVITNMMELWNMLIVFGLVACAVTFQRVAFQAAIPQIVPKRYLGHANGMFQSVTGVANFIAPLFGVGLLALFGLPGVLIFDVASYLFAIGTVLVIKFPAAMAELQESLWREIRGGFRFSMRNKSFRAMLIYFALVNMFLAPLISLVNPLVLSFTTLEDVAVVAAVAGLGGVVGGLLMGIWGGPKERRMDAVRWLTIALGVCALVAASRPNLITICIGVFGLSAIIVLVNGIVMTIIQSKVPARMQGRVFSINTMVATAAAPLGFGVLAPQGSALMEWLMKTSEGFRDTTHLVLGDGDGRHIALVYVLCGLVAIGMVVVTLGWRTLTHFDDDVPDARPDDLIGLAQSKARRRDGGDFMEQLEDSGSLDVSS